MNDVHLRKPMVSIKPAQEKEKKNPFDLVPPHPRIIIDINKKKIFCFSNSTKRMSVVAKPKKKRMKFIPILRKEQAIRLTSTFISLYIYGL